MKKLILAITTITAVLFGLKAENVYYNVGPFYKLSVRGDVDVVYCCNPDSTGMARYDDANFPEEPFELSINKGKLDVRRPLNATGERPVLYLWSDFLMDVSNEGNGEMSLGLSAAVPEFSASLIGNGKIMVDNVNATDVNMALKTGNGSIVVNGKCKDAYYTMIGVGLIQADNLDAQTVDCKVLGTGTIGCSPLKSLNVHGIGTTKIYYSGSPEIKNVSGSKLYPILEVQSSDDEDAEEAEETEVDE